MKIISKRDPSSGLKVALDLESWKIQPMEYNEDLSQWEYTPELGGKQVEKIHFKFIDADGTWFTDIDFPKEFDSDGNENNVVYAKENGLELDEFAEDSKDQDSESQESTPKQSSADESKKVLAEEPSAASVEQPNTPGSATADVTEDRPQTSDTTLTQRSDNVVEYSSLLDRVVHFLKRFIKKWFSFQGRRS